MDEESCRSPSNTLRSLLPGIAAGLSSQKMSNRLVEYVFGSEAELLSTKRESPEAPESLFDTKNPAQPSKCLCEGVHRSGKLLVCCRLDHALNIFKYSIHFLL